MKTNTHAIEPYVVAVPVVRVAFDTDAAAGLKVLEDERARPVGLILHRIEPAGWHDTAVAVSAEHREFAKWCVHHDTKLVLAFSLHRPHWTKHIVGDPGCGFIESPLDGCRHVGRCELLAAMKAHALAQGHEPFLTVLFCLP